VTIGEPATLDVTTLPEGPEDEPDVAIGHVDRPARPDPADSDIVTVSASIIAMGEPAVATEKVAAIGGEKQRPLHETPLPLVIRGGVIGDAFTPATAATPAPETVEQPQSGQEASEAGGGGGSQPAPRKNTPEQPAAPPPPPPPSPQATTRVE